MKTASRNCKNCGELFVPKNSKSSFCHITRIKACINCEKEYKEECGGYTKSTCSSSCSAKIKRKPNITKKCLRCQNTFSPNNTQQLYCRKKLKLICKVCENAFERICGDSYEGLVCSRECHAINNLEKARAGKSKLREKKCKICHRTFQGVALQIICHTKAIAECLNCKKEFLKECSGSDSKYKKEHCSQKCFFETQRKRVFIECLSCKNSFNSETKNKKKICPDCIISKKEAKERVILEKLFIKELRKLKILREKEASNQILSKLQDFIFDRFGLLSKTSKKDSITRKFLSYSEIMLKMNLVFAKKDLGKINIEESLEKNSRSYRVILIEGSIIDFLRELDSIFGPFFELVKKRKEEIDLIKKESTPSFLTENEVKNFLISKIELSDEAVDTIVYEDDKTSLKFNTLLKWRCALCGSVYSKQATAQKKNKYLKCSNCRVPLRKIKRKMTLSFHDWCVENKEFEMLKEWSKDNLLSAKEVSYGSSKGFLFGCPEGHKYMMAVKSRRISPIGCPYCTNQKVLPGFNDLETEFSKNERIRILSYWGEKNKKPPSQHFTNHKCWWKCTSCGKEFLRRATKMRLDALCKRCYNSEKGSYLEKEIRQAILESFEGELIFNKKFHNKFEIDIFDPTSNRGIEVNGDYWHSNKSWQRDNNMRKEIYPTIKDYHVAKKKFFNDIGIDIMAVWEHEWHESPTETTSNILSFLTQD